MLPAGEPPVPIEGVLLIQGGDAEYDWSRWLVTGTSDNIVPLPEALSAYFTVEPSPQQDEYAYTFFTDYTPGDFPRAGDIGRVGLDGSDPIALTALAGFGGLNCSAIWSPDGSQLAFMHADPVDGEAPCETGFSVWVIDADGSGLRCVSPPQAGSSYPISWAPNGYRLLCKGNIQDSASEPYTYIIDSDGSNYSVLWTGFGGHVEWSRDGAKLLATCYEGGEVDGQEGHWKILRLYDPDGSNPQELFRNGMTQAEVMEIIDAQSLSGEWAGPAIITRLAPAAGHWSPLGDRIAFTGAMDYTPTGPAYNLQTEVWIYDLATQDVTRITDNLVEEGGLHWDGYNTFPYYTSVTVDSTTVTFDDVTTEGLTNILVDTTPPAMPPGEGALSFVYEIKTTCTPSGSIMVEMTYRDEDLPSGTAEVDLSIYHWDADTETWEDITVSRDLENNLVTGITDSLSPFTMTLPQRFTDVTLFHWGYQYVEACAKAGIVGGYPNGTYQPDWAVTRNQMAIYISRALAGGDEYVPTGPEQPNFPDVPADDVCYKYIEYAYANQIVFGYPNGEYRPGYQVDRGQMAVFVARAIATPTGEPGMATYTPPPTPTFADVTPDPLDPYQVCYKYVEYIADRGVTQGYPDLLYHPERVVSRGLMAIYVARAFGLL